MRNTNGRFPCRLALVNSWHFTIHGKEMLAIIAFLGSWQAGLLSCTEQQLWVMLDLDWSISLFKIFSGSFLAHLGSNFVYHFFVYPYTVMVLKSCFIQTILRANYKSILKWRSSLIYLQIESWSYQWSIRQKWKKRNISLVKQPIHSFSILNPKLSLRLPHPAFS